MLLHDGKINGDDDDNVPFLYQFHQPRASIYYDRKGQKKNEKNATLDCIIDITTMNMHSNRGRTIYISWNLPCLRFFSLFLQFCLFCCSSTYSACSTTIAAILYRIGNHSSQLHNFSVYNEYNAPSPPSVIMLIIGALFGTWQFTEKS